MIGRWSKFRCTIVRLYARAPVKKQIAYVLDTTIVFFLENQLYQHELEFDLLNLFMNNQPEIQSCDIV